MVTDGYHARPVDLVESYQCFFWFRMQPCLSVDLRTVDSRRDTVLVSLDLKDKDDRWADILYHIFRNTINLPFSNGYEFLKLVFASGSACLAHEANAVPTFILNGGPGLISILSE